MSAIAKGVFILGAKRTAFGTFGGKLVNHSNVELQSVAAQAAIASSKVNPENIDSVIIGNVLQASSPDGIFLARHVGLKCGVPLEKPALTVNRLCGSGFQAVVNGAQEIQSGAANIVLTGGTDNMSQTPFAVRNIRFGTALGKTYQFEDMLWIGLTDTYCKLAMAQTAEKLGEQYNVSKEEVDKFALRSQTLWKAAQDGGKFKEEIAPIVMKSKKGDYVFDCDEHPRPKTTLEGLAKLPTLFKPNGLVTAGTASGVCDGAGAVLVASEEAVKQHDLKPLARLVAYTTVGVEPSIMGIGPAPAIKQLLKITGKTLNDIDLIEINEAFAAQTLACVKELNLDINKLNVNGGAIALGHPLAASGARITGHLIHELKRRGGKLGIGSACIGGGQGIALLVEVL